MRKALILFAGAIMLAGCGNNAQSQELTFNELYELSDQLYGSVSDSIDNLNDVELYGTSNDLAEQNQHFTDVFEDYMEVALEGCKIERGEKITVSGYFGGYLESDSTSRFFDNGRFICDLNQEVVENDEWTDFIWFRSDDEAFLTLEENAPIKIEGVFLKPGVALDDCALLYDCVIVN